MNPPNSAVPFSSLKYLQQLGFVGFALVRDLQATDCAAVLDEPGVYVVVRESDQTPSFLSKSIGGHFKGRDPTVQIAKLQTKWIVGTNTLYIGMAARQTLRRRVNQLMQFGCGKPVGHWGGRYLWQIEGSSLLQVGWMPSPDPATAESALLASFCMQFGALPFANLRG